MRCGGCRKWICSECEIVLFGQSYCSRCIYLYQDLPGVFRRLAQETQDKVQLAQEHERMQADLRVAEQTKKLYDEVQENYRKLKDLEQLRDSLVHMVVHDLRTPLTSLLTGLQSVSALGSLNPEQDELLSISVEGGRTLLDMINELLDVSKMEEGSFVLERSPIDVSMLAEHARSQVAVLAENKRLTLTIDLAPDLPSIQADEDKIRRLLVNLLGNAIKFTPESGAVALRASHDGAGIHISVTDTGEGIPPESFEKIFEKFGQVENRQAGRKMSTGLGLTFCKMVAEAHGGKIWVESELGHGSTFHVVLPS